MRPEWNIGDAERQQQAENLAGVRPRSNRLHSVVQLTPLAKLGGTAVRSLAGLRNGLAAKP